MRHPIVEASARLLLFLVDWYAFQRAGDETRQWRFLVREHADVYSLPVADGFQVQQAYVSSSGKEPPRHQPPGYISGTILDQSGAVSAGAEVRLTDDRPNFEPGDKVRQQWAISVRQCRSRILSPDSCRARLRNARILCSSAPRGNLSGPSDHPGGSGGRDRSACKRQSAHPSPGGGYAD